MKIEKLEKNQQIKSREAEVCRFPKAGGGRRKERAGRAGRMYSWDGVAIMGVSIAGTLFCELISWILIYRKSSYKSLVASITRWVGEDAEREPNRRTTTGPDPPTALSLSLSLSIIPSLARRCSLETQDGKDPRGHEGGERGPAHQVQVAQEEGGEAGEAAEGEQLRAAEVEDDGNRLCESYTPASHAHTARLDSDQTRFRRADSLLCALSPPPSSQSSVALLILYTLTSRHFSGQIVAKLPFEAPWIIKGATQRGLNTGDLTDCSMTYVYVVCSAGLRPNIQKLLGFTPPRQVAQQKNPFEPKKEED